MRHQRRTPLLQRMVQIAGILLADRGSARLLHLLHAKLARTSVLSHLMSTPTPSPVTPQVLRVDDFALYGRVYCTLLVDADTRLPIELWEGCDAETLRDWLQAHPGVQIVCHDGSTVYRQSITSGAPDAIQVSDRFDLWQGLSRRVQQVATAHRGCLPAAIPDPPPNPPVPADAQVPATELPTAQLARRLFDAVHALTDTGMTFSAAARQLGLNRRTVEICGSDTWQEVAR